VALSDPLHTIPILDVGDFTYSTGTSNWAVQYERRLCAADDYLPFFVLRYHEDVRSLQVGSGLESLQCEGNEDSQSSEAGVWMRKYKS